MLFAEKMFLTSWINQIFFFNFNETIFIDFNANRSLKLVNDFFLFFYFRVIIKTLIQNI